MEASSGRWDGIATALAKARDEALKPSDLTKLRANPRNKVTPDVDRLVMLEHHADAFKQVIAESPNADAFFCLNSARAIL